MLRSVLETVEVPAGKIRILEIGQPGKDQPGKDSATDSNWGEGTGAIVGLIAGLDAVGRGLV